MILELPAAVFISFNFISFQFGFVAVCVSYVHQVPECLERWLLLLL